VLTLLWRSSHVNISTFGGAIPFHNKEAKEKVSGCAILSSLLGKI